MPAVDEARFARLKQCIGFSDEPVQDAQGYWTIGYGRRLNNKRGGPRPAAVISEAMADEELRYRVAALAAMGRGGDTEVAHVALGEIVLPTALQTPDVMRALSTAADRAGVSLDRLRIGMPQNSVNPRTGAPEFGTFSNHTSGGKTEGGYDDDDQVGGADMGALSASIPDIYVEGTPIYERVMPEIVIEAPIPPVTPFESFATGFADPYWAGAQLLDHMGGDPHVMDHHINDRENAYYGGRTAAGHGEHDPDLARDFGRLISGGLLSFGFGGPNPLLSAAIDGALQPLKIDPSGDFWTEKGRQALEESWYHLGER
jgi:hypothetical protein